MLSWYNNFSPDQRQRSQDALNQLHAEGIYPCTKGPCQLCGDPHADTEPHSEDYSEPFKWDPPYTYAVCGSCHWWIHHRFNRPQMWDEFVEHVKRGGYARELTSPEVMKERKAYRKAMAQGESYRWKLIPGRIGRKGGHWWNKLSCSPQT